MKLSSIAKYMVLFAIPGSIGLALMNCEAGLDDSNNPSQVKDAEIRAAILVPDTEITDNDYVGVRVELDDDPAFGSINQTFNDTAHVAQDGGGADFVIPIGLSPTVADGNWYIRVSVYSNTVQANVFTTGILEALSNTPQISLAADTVTTVTLALDWNPLANGNSSLVVEGENSDAFWLGGALSLGSGANIGEIMDTTTAAGGAGFTGFTITVLNAAGTVVYGTIVGNPASGTFYGKVVVPQGSATVDIQVSVTGSAEVFTAFEALATIGGDNFAYTTGSTHTLDIVSD